MFDQTVKSVMRRQSIVKATPQTSVTQAAKLMARKNVGAVLVLDGERLIGIFTERDIAYRVVARARDPQATPVVDVMTPAPMTISPNQPFGAALLKMSEQGFRHLPVVDGEKVVGIVSSRTAMDPALEEFVSEAHRREHYGRSSG